MLATVPVPALLREHELAYPANKAAALQPPEGWQGRYRNMPENAHIVVSPHGNY
jgi:hypothetical protein